MESLSDLHVSGTALTLRFCSSSESDSYSEILSLPWHNKDHINMQDIQQPTVIETSKWTKMISGKACIAFGINSVGFEHELLDLILHMEQKRLEQSRKKKKDTRFQKRKWKKKGKQRYKNSYAASIIMGGISS